MVCWQQNGEGCCKCLLWMQQQHWPSTMEHFCSFQKFNKWQEARNIFLPHNLFGRMSIFSGTSLTVLSGLNFCIKIIQHPYEGMNSLGWFFEFLLWVQKSHKAYDSGLLLAHKQCEIMCSRIMKAKPVFDAHNPLKMSRWRCFHMGRHWNWGKYFIPNRKNRGIRSLLPKFARTNSCGQNVAFPPILLITATQN